MWRLDETRRPELDRELQMEARVPHRFPVARGNSREHEVSCRMCVAYLHIQPGHSGPESEGSEGSIPLLGPDEHLRKAAFSGLADSGDGTGGNREGIVRDPTRDGRWWALYVEWAATFRRPGSGDGGEARRVVPTSTGIVPAKTRQRPRRRHSQWTVPMPTAARTAAISAVLTGVKAAASHANGEGAPA